MEEIVSQQRIRH